MNEKKRKVNHEWRRVQRTETPEAERMRQLRNKSVLGLVGFKTKCEELGLPITKRQASKFNNSKGLVFKSMRRKATNVQNPWPR